MEPLNLGFRITMASVILGTISLDKRAGVPLHRQIFEALREAVLTGRLKPGSRLPSTRALAAELGVARNTVITAFEQLVAEGYLSARVGSGTRVAPIAPDALLKPGSTIRAVAERRRGSTPGLSKRGQLLAGTPRRAALASRTAFQTGLPALDRFPFALWSRLLARRARRPARDLLGYDHVGGYGPLREAITAYLGPARGVNCSPDQVIVVSGAQAAMDLAARLLLDPGDSAWHEEPGFLGARGALLAAGAHLHPVPVDGEGLNAEWGERICPRARLVHVTPSCQFPLGVTMSLDRRLQLLDWAARTGAWILEDDYDSEYRYRGRPISALQGLDSTERIIYIGTFSKTMFPTLRLGYLVVPPGLADAFRTALRHTGQEAPLMLQAALADFISEGHYATHLRRMRVLYAARQALFIDLAMKHLKAWLTVVPSEAGMQVTAYLAKGLDDRAVSEEAKASGLSVAPLSSYYFKKPRRSGLFLGYAGVPESEMQLGMKKLQQILRALG